MPENKKYTLTLKFPLHSEEELDTTELARMLQYIMQDRQDVRHCFEAEMITSGLSRCLKRALLDVVEKEAQDEFGHETIRHSGGRGYTPKWYIEATKRFAGRKKPWFKGEPEVEIT